MRQQAAVTCLGVLGCVWQCQQSTHDTSRFSAVTAQNTVCPCLPAPMLVWFGFCSSAPASRGKLNHPPLHHQPRCAVRCVTLILLRLLNKTPKRTAWRLQHCSSRQSTPTQPVQTTCDLPHPPFTCSAAVDGDVPDAHDCVALGVGLAHLMQQPHINTTQRHPS